MTINVGARSNSLKYGADDDIRQKFTGYKKDEETKLDFAEAWIWEQMFVSRYGLEKNCGDLLNKMHSISPQRWGHYGIE